ncbi:GGCT glutamylcyclotransferase, partial [Amia calva]|nr:GGCT glutamylcyclotransferase [Amia calva]
MSNEGHFFYFAYGSNLLKERLRLKNPSAQLHCTGRVQDYMLNFGTCGGNKNNRWHGGVATIEESQGHEVWGVVWKMSHQNLHSLDEQEGISLGIYKPIYVRVETEDEELLCRSYQMNNFLASLTSPQYKEVVCSGARQNNLPLEYIKKLEAIETNNYSGPTILDEIKGFPS